MKPSVKLAMAVVLGAGDTSVESRQDGGSPSGSGGPVSPSGIRQPGVDHVKLPLVDQHPLQQLAKSSRELDRSLDRFSNGDSWKTYLALPSEVFDSARANAPSIDALHRALARFDAVNRNPDYQMIAELPAFQVTHEQLARCLGRDARLARRRPGGLNIGGENGVQFGGGQGARFGGPHGVQFGGGQGARFGGPHGVQFGGGQGVRIGRFRFGG